MEVTEHKTTRLVLPPPKPATVLKHCRCIDCRHWNDGRGLCRVMPFRRYVSPDDYHLAMRPFRTDLGMIQPDAWHYCALYRGPQVSRDVWAWPKATRQAAEVGAGAKTSAKVEPVADPAVGDEVLV